MKIEQIDIKKFIINLNNISNHKSIIIKLTSNNGFSAIGEVAPLQNYSSECYEEAFHQICEIKSKVLSLDWQLETFQENLKQFKLLPSVSFGIESALISMLKGSFNFKISTSALFLGSPQQILNLSEKKKNFKTAKLKVGHLTFQEAFTLIQELKDKFRLRIDVNRAWSTKESLHFFSQFEFDAFDYVEEPFKNPADLKFFTHPLAVDESFPTDLTFDDLEQMPNLKALIYKPTIQGGLTNCKPAYEWAKNKHIDFILSASFESELGLSHIARMGYLLNLKEPLGIGTYDYLTTHQLQDTFFIKDGFAHCIV